MDRPDPWPALEPALRDGWPGRRPAATWPSRVTSVDTKLVYNRSTDAIEPFVIGDINANPEGIPTRDEHSDDDVVETVAGAYLRNLRNLQADGAGPSDVAVVLPPEVFDADAGGWIDPDSRLTADRRSVYAAVAAHPAVERVVPSPGADGLAAADEGLVAVDPRDDARVAADGYVNLDDTGAALFDALGGDVAAMSRGANAPTAVWTPRFEWTGKLGLLRKAAALGETAGGIHSPEFARVERVADVEAFRDAVGGPVVLKGPFGTYGDEVVAIGVGESVPDRIDEEERRVRRIRDDPGFAMRDGNELAFDARDGGVGYGVVEEAITGSGTADGGRYEVLECRADGTYPVDVIPLVVGAADGVAVPSVFLRLSGEQNLNANIGGDAVELFSLDRAYDGPVAVSSADGGVVEFDLAEGLARIAGRPVARAEVERAARRAGQFGFAVRNATALAVERELTR